MDFNFIQQKAEMKLGMRGNEIVGEKRYGDESKWSCDFMCGRNKVLWRRNVETQRVKLELNGI